MAIGIGRLGRGSNHCFQNQRSDGSHRGVIGQMIYSTIDKDCQIECFETSKDAIEHARKTGATPYRWGHPIERQLEFEFTESEEE